MKKILVVDDEEMIVNIMEKFLTMSGFGVVRAVGGEAAMKVLDSDERIDLMIVDMRMPDISGIDVVKKKIELKKKFPVLFLTGAVDAGSSLDEIEKEDITENDILLKPVDLSVLLGKIKDKLKIS